MKTIRRGDAGSDVIAWQSVLAADPKPTRWTNAGGEAREWSAAWAWPIARDGIFGERTHAATEAWQAARGLVADGIVGPKTWNAAGAVTEATPPSTADEDLPTGIELVPAKNYTRGRRQAVRLLVIHTMENEEIKRAARSAAHWFAAQPARGTLVDARIRPDPNGKPWGGSSAHYNVDADEIVQSVRETDTAWHAGAVNDYSIGIEHAGTANQSATDWADDFSTRMLRRSATLAAELCRRYRIPVVKLSPEDLKAGKPGFCGHVDSTVAFGPPNGHWDPGPSFPWQAYLAEVERQLAKLDGDVHAPAPEPIVAPALDDDPAWIEVTHAGVKWLVSPAYIAPVGIGEAAEIARRRGCVLPTPELVDDIHRAASVKVDAARLRRTDFVAWSQAEMNAPSVIADQARRVAEAIEEASKAAGQAGDASRTLVAGTHKDVVQHKDGRIGLYGWHRPDGTRLQPFYAGHAASWKDYSQGLRLVRRA